MVGLGMMLAITMVWRLSASVACVVASFPRLPCSRMQTLKLCRWGEPGVFSYIVPHGRKPLKFEHLPTADSNSGSYIRYMSTLERCSNFRGFWHRHGNVYFQGSFLLYMYSVYTDEKGKLEAKMRWASEEVIKRVRGAEPLVRPRNMLWPGLIWSRYVNVLGIRMRIMCLTRSTWKVRSDEMAKLEALTRWCRVARVLCLSHSRVSEWSK